MSNKQTAVEFLVEQLETIIFYSDEAKENIIEQAKAIEKEQIIDAHGSKNRGGFKSNGEFFLDILTGEQYYNEKYNNQSYDNGNNDN